MTEYLLHDGRVMTEREMMEHIYRLEKKLAPFDFTRTCQDVPDGEPEVTYHPWGNGTVVGFEIIHRPTGKVEYLYLNPSDNIKGEDVPNVFVYQGERGDPSVDGPHHHYTVFEDEYGTSVDSNPYNITLDEHEALHSAEGSFLLYDEADKVYNDENGNGDHDPEMIAGLVRSKMLEWDQDEGNTLVITDTGVKAHDAF